jgi:hypothetical protein
VSLNFFLSLVRTRISEKMSRSRIAYALLFACESAVTTHAWITAPAVQLQVPSVSRWVRSEGVRRRRNYALHVQSVSSGGTGSSGSSTEEKSYTDELLQNFAVMDTSSISHGVMDHEPTHATHHVTTDPSPAFFHQLPAWMQDENFIQKAVNFLVLCTSFGYVLYTILNIDNGITRGWTHNVSCLASGELWFIYARSRVLY